MENTFKDGFLDGLRYAGHLLDDVEDVNLSLDPMLQGAIGQAFQKRYGKWGNSNEKLHKFITELIMETEENKQEIKKLKRLAETGRPVEKSSTDYLELV